MVPASAGQNRRWAGAVPLEIIGLLGEWDLHWASCPGSWAASAFASLSKEVFSASAAAISASYFSSVPCEGKSLVDWLSLIDLSRCHLRIICMICSHSNLTSNRSLWPSWNDSKSPMRYDPLTSSFTPRSCVATVHQDHGRMIPAHLHA